jgi:hypothetical protein
LWTPVRRLRLSERPTWPEERLPSVPEQRALLWAPGQEPTALQWFERA